MWFKKKNRENKDKTDGKRAFEEDEYSFEESEESLEEKENTPKEKMKTSHLFVSFLTGAILLAAVATNCYAIFKVIYENTAVKNETFITLQGKSYSESVKILESFGTKDPQKSKKNKIRDVALLGTKLFLSESKISPTLYSGTNDSKIITGESTGFGLYNLTKDAYIPSYSQKFSTGKYFIDLNPLEKGDYIIFPDQENRKDDKADCYPYSLFSNEVMDETIYSLPKEDGSRTKISIKGNSSSPYLILRVEDYSSILPKDYYDAVIYKNFYKKSETSLEKMPQLPSEEFDSYIQVAESVNRETNYKVKAVSSLTEADREKAIVAIGLSSFIDQDIASLYTYKQYRGEGVNQKLLDSGELKGYDLYPEIRELTGAVSKAGEAYVDVVGNDVLEKKISILGKETFLVRSYDNDAGSLSSRSNADIIKSVLNWL